MLEYGSLDLRSDVITGLSRKRKSIHPKYLYDETGSRLFEEICQVKEYYPTRTEMRILRENAREMSEVIGAEAVIVEPGAGTGAKLRLLLEHLIHPLAYVPVEISPSPLSWNVEQLRSAFPELEVHPICADYTRPFALPAQVRALGGKRIVFFPGSTIGNFEPREARLFLERMARLVGSEGGLLIGVDLKKDANILRHAYDDQAGVTARFNLNLLTRLNRELSANFQLSSFRHQARYNPRLGRVEMHLVSRSPQVVQIDGKVFFFKKGESIHTECSYKYSVQEFERLASRAGFAQVKHWMDPAELFCVYYFERP